MADQAIFPQSSGLPDQSESPKIPSELSILPLRNTVAFPLTGIPLSVQRPESVQLVDQAALGDRILGLAAMKAPKAERAEPDDVYRVGTAASIHRLIKSPSGEAGLLVLGLERIRILEFTQSEPYLVAKVEVIPDTVEEGIELEARARNTTELFSRLIQLTTSIPDEMALAIANADDPRQLLYLVANLIRVDTEAAQEILEMDRLDEKLARLNTLLRREIDVLELGKKIQTEARDEMEKTQREYFLRQQMKAIQRELGEVDEQTKAIEELRERIESAGMSKEAESEALRELERLESMPQAAAEYSVIRTYLDWLTSLPWRATTEDNRDIARARDILNTDHYGLDEIKERILEYLAVRKLHLERSGDSQEEPFKGAILNFVGPPGTGKTSLGRSIARALDREFIRMSLGGVRDEAEIRGHRRTYIGALPGRIIQAMKRCGTKNPVFMLDEVDKMGMDFRGDPASALLEVLDPEQNHTFRDHYLDVDFDLSQVMFITTANLTDTIPPPLLDRMETLRLDGYTEEEKLRIAQGYLIPRQIEAHSLKDEEISFDEPALRTIISDYTREAGVRNLEREIGTVCRKVATEIAAGEGKSVTVDPEAVRGYLGVPRFYNESAERTQIPGVATGLAVTATGGDILFIEATKMAGKGSLVTTGRLGEVMRESAQAALSWVRSRSEALQIDDRAFAENDIHIHFPAGAIPKDGPSAGVTTATALVSLMTGRPVSERVGMTGEITLRGRVLPVGGIKQKVLAAHRAGLKTVILPRRNEADLEELPQQARESLTFTLVETIDEVLSAALTEGSPEDPSEATEPTPTRQRVRA